MESLLVSTVSVISKESEAVLREKWDRACFNFDLLWRLSDKEIHRFLFLVYFDFVFSSPYISYSSGADTSFISILDDKPSNCFDSTLFLILAGRRYDSRVSLSITDNHCWLSLGNENLETTIRLSDSETVLFRGAPNLGQVRVITDLEQIAAEYIINLMVNSENLRDRKIISYSEDKYRHQELYKILESTDLLRFPESGPDKALFALAKRFLFDLEIDSALSILSKVSRSTEELLQNLLSILIDFQFWKERFNRETTFERIRKIRDRAIRKWFSNSIESLSIRIDELLIYQ